MYDMNCMILKRSVLSYINFKRKSVEFKLTADKYSFKVSMLTRVFSALVS
jgi:hypothetical protein